MSTATSTCSPGLTRERIAASGKYGGKTYAVPQVTDTLGLLYNKKLLSEAGHDAPPATINSPTTTSADAGD